LSAIFKCDFFRLAIDEKVPMRRVICVWNRLGTALLRSKTMLLLCADNSFQVTKRTLLAFHHGCPYRKRLEIGSSAAALRRKKSLKPRPAMPFSEARWRAWAWF
jgi:hypothetical protein